MNHLSKLQLDEDATPEQIAHEDLRRAGIFYENHIQRRNAAIARARREGLTWNAICHAFGISEGTARKYARLGEKTEAPACHFCGDTTEDMVSTMIWPDGTMDLLCWECHDGEAYARGKRAAYNAMAKEFPPAAQYAAIKKAVIMAPSQDPRAKFYN